MNILAVYGDGHDEQVYVCELSWYEMIRITNDELKVGAEVNVPDVGQQAREMSDAASKIVGILRTARRSASLLQSLNEEIGAARLDVNDKKMPDLSVIRAHIAYLEALTKDVMPNA